MSSWLCDVSSFQCSLFSWCAANKLECVFFKFSSLFFSCCGDDEAASMHFSAHKQLERCALHIWDSKELFQVARRWDPAIRRMKTAPTRAVFSLLPLFDPTKRKVMRKILQKLFFCRLLAWQHYVVGIKKQEKKQNEKWRIYHHTKFDDNIKIIKTLSSASSWKRERDRDYESSETKRLSKLLMTLWIVVIMLTSRRLASFWLRFDAGPGSLAASMMMPFVPNKKEEKQSEKKWMVK